MMNWLDSHCHINDEAFKDDIAQVMERMAENDVLQAMIISSHIADYEYGFSLHHPKLIFKHSLGIYPGDVDETDEKLFENFAKLFKEERCQAIGEIGLDYHWGSDNREKQLDIFDRQLKLAKELDKPVIIHSRDALEDTYDLLSRYQLNGVMHCYSYDSEAVRKFLNLGFYISMTGTITWKKAEEALKVIRNVPLDRLLIETDCPYLSPQPYRGKRNEPAYVVYTGRKIAEELTIPEENFKKQINENYQRLFRL